MYASIWWLEGDPGELAGRYDAMLADIPRANMRLHLCLQADDGIVIVDTCPSREAFEAFADGLFRMLRELHGLPEPKRVDGFPVHAAFAAGDRVEALSP
ncbi:MAG TPA: hypothetical protein VGH82_06390 [Gaiellaceae bacterium]|jgi:hypothetical protein